MQASSASSSVGQTRRVGNRRKTLEIRANLWPRPCLTVNGIVNSPAPESVGRGRRCDMFAEDYWLTALVFAAPIAAVLAGRLAWSARCARTRRGACRIWQFGCRELLVLFTLLCIILGGVSLARRSDVDEMLFSPNWDWHFHYVFASLVPSIVWMAWGIPVVAATWQFAAERLNDLGQPKPPRPEVRLDWMAQTFGQARRPPHNGGGHSTNPYE